MTTCIHLQTHCVYWKQTKIMLVTRCTIHTYALCASSLYSL